MPSLTLELDNRDDIAAALGSGRWIVACLCAAWCGTCASYRGAFDTLAARHPDKTFVWIDVEDQAEVVGDLDVENFLELQSNAVVTGTIRYRQLKMDVGATVQGQLIRVQPRNAAAPADNVVELGSEKAAAAGAERR